MKLSALNLVTLSKLLLSLFIVAFTNFSCDKECEEKKCVGGYTKIYAPVCGCNNVTYSNSSEAECKGITTYTEGKCKEDEDDSECEAKMCNDAVIEIYDPVCGCDSVTYSNYAEAECHGITSYTKGECKKDEGDKEEPNCEERTCTESYITVYDPVCGCNNVTYSNSSEAECHNIKEYTKGACEEE